MWGEHMHPSENSSGRVVMPMHYESALPHHNAAEILEGLHGDARSIPEGVIPHHARADKRSITQPWGDFGGCNIIGDVLPGQPIIVPSCTWNEACQATARRHRRYRKAIEHSLARRLTHFIGRRCDDYVPVLPRPHANPKQSGSNAQMDGLSEPWDDEHQLSDCTDRSDAAQHGSTIHLYICWNETCGLRMLSTARDVSKLSEAWWIGNGALLRNLAQQILED
jgi:hypothetical protein